MSRTHALETSAGRQIPAANQYKSIVRIPQVWACVWRRFEPDQNRTRIIAPELQKGFAERLVRTGLRLVVETLLNQIALKRQSPAEAFFATADEGNTAMPK